MAMKMTLPKSRLAAGLKHKMKLGVFDSGLGGLVMAKAIRDRLPDIDMLYYGDTLHLPYGNRSSDTIYNYSRNAVERMFERDCNLIVIACNTASATALRRLQQQFLPEGKWPGRNIIGVVVPTLEAAIAHGHRRLGLIATNYTIGSQVYQTELLKLEPSLRIYEQATPLLVPLVENDGLRWAEDILRHYLAPLIEKQIQCLMLGCTHYPALKEPIRKILGQNIEILSQDEILPEKLGEYLKRHPEYANKIGMNGKSEFYVSDLTDNYLKAAQRIYGHDIKVEQI